MATASDVVRQVADGELEPKEGARQLEALFGGPIVGEAAGDPKVDRVNQLIQEITPETTPTIVTIIVTIKRC